MRLDEESRKRLMDALSEQPVSESELWMAYWGRHAKFTWLPDNVGMIVENLLAAGKEKASRSRAILVHGRYGMGKSSFMGAIQQAARDHDQRPICLWINMPALTSQIDSTALAAVMAEIVTCLRERDELSCHKCMEGLDRRIEDLWHIEAKTFASPCHDPCNPIAPPEENRMAGDLRGNSRRHVRANTLEQAIDACLDAIGKQIVVFLDDLDRCDNRVPVNVVRLLLRFGTTRLVHFVLACDWDVLEHGVREWMKWHGSDGGGAPLVTANSALGKYVHMTVELPGMGEPVIPGYGAALRRLPRDLFALFSAKGRIVNPGDNAATAYREKTLCDVFVNELLSNVCSPEEKTT